MPTNDTQKPATSTPVSATPSTPERTIEQPTATVDRTATATPQLSTITASHREGGYDMPQATQENNSASADKVNQNVAQQEQPRKAMSVEERISQLSSKNVQSGLTVEERAELENLQKSQKPEADARVTQKNDTDRPMDDPEKNKFSEGDVIKYMYEHWLIDGAMWCDQKIRKYGLYGYERLRAATKEYVAECRANDAKKKAFREKVENSSTYATHKKIEDLFNKKNEEILKSSEAQNKQITEIGKAIDNGTLFDEENKGLLNSYKQLTNSDNDEKSAAKLEQIRLACEAKKNNPQSKETTKLGVEFARDARLNLEFDSEAMLAANNATAAEMMDAVAHDKNAFANGLEDAYDQKHMDNSERIILATQKDREKALNTAEDFDRTYHAALMSGMEGTQAANHIYEQREKEIYKTLETMKTLSGDALHDAKLGIERGEFQEVGKEPKRNEKLDEFSNYVVERLPADGRREQSQEEQHKEEQRQNDEGQSHPDPKQGGENQPKEPPHDYTRQGVRDYVENPVNVPTVAQNKQPTKDDRPKTLRDEARVQGASDQTNAQNRTSVADREMELQALQEQHDARGSHLQDRFARIKARAEKNPKANESEFMMDTMIAEHGDMNKEQQGAVLDAAINADKGQGKTKEERILDNMIRSGKFNEDQLNTALYAGIAMEIRNRKGRV